MPRCWCTPAARSPGCSASWPARPSAVPPSPPGSGSPWGRQCCGSMTFWGGSGSGSADPCLWLMDPDPGSGSCYFRHWPSRCQQKTHFLNNFFCLLLFEAKFTSFFKDKKSKRVTKYYFSMMIEGSRRPKNIWIRWIRMIRIRIRIRNTALRMSLRLRFTFPRPATMLVRLSMAMASVTLARLVFKIGPDSSSTCKKRRSYKSVAKTFHTIKY